MPNTELRTVLHCEKLNLNSASESFSEWGYPANTVTQNCVKAEVSKHRDAHGTQGRLHKAAMFALRHSFNRCLPSANYAPGIGTGDLSENKTNTNPHLLGTYILVRGKRAILKIKNEARWVSEVVINAGRQWGSEHFRRASGRS